jgi:hypothetical protein
MNKSLWFKSIFYKFIILQVFPLTTPRAFPGSRLAFRFAH